MQWWWILAAALLACALVAALAYGIGVRRASHPQHPANPTKSPAKSPSPTPLFGTAPSVRVAEEAFVRALPEAVALVAAGGAVLYAREDFAAFALSDAARVRNEDVLGMLAQVARDGRSREREIEVMDSKPQTANPLNHSGHGIRPGDAAPTSPRYLKVRVSPITPIGSSDAASTPAAPATPTTQTPTQTTTTQTPPRFALFVADVSEQRRFADMRRDFVTNVSHELKTPTGAIALLVETIADAADDPQAVRYFSGRIAKESQRLTELVQRLIELQRAQDAPATLAPKRLSVLAVVRAAVDANRVQAERRHIAVTPSLDGIPVGAEPRADEPDAVVCCDESALTTAVKNLVENAIHYSPEHTTVRVAITRSASPQTPAPGTVTIRVIDQGIGIPAASIGRVFERFYRVDPARSRNTGGSGLGLAITKHCVEECGGTITVWSREHEGSTFTIELPEAAPTANPAPAANRKPQTPSGPTANPSIPPTA